jgi:hypothetical protein
MGCGEVKLSKYLTQTFMAHCNAMICQQVMLSGDAEWPKVADAVIEADIDMHENAKKQRLVDATIHALLTAPTVGKAAEIAGVSETSIRKWLKEPSFRQKYRETRQSMFENAIGTVQAKMLEGVKAMWSLVLNEANPATARVQAFRVLAEMAFKAQDLSELEERLEALEQRTHAA